jgi:hypothetical protein
MKVKTADLTGIALDWAVAKCLPDDEYLFDPHPYLPDENGQPHYFKPSTDWSLAGPIIEQEGIAVRKSFTDERNEWTSIIWTDSKTVFESGPTPLVAAMRCYVAWKLGDEVEVPEELE